MRRRADRILAICLATLALLSLALSPPARMPVHVGRPAASVATAVAALAAPMDGMADGAAAVCDRRCGHCLDCRTGGSCRAGEAWLPATTADRPGPGLVARLAYAIAAPRGRAHPIGPPDVPPPRENG